MTDKETLKLSNVTLNWAFLGHKNTVGDYASGKYEITAIITKEQADSIRALGISAKQKIKDAGDGMYKITLKSNVEPLVFNKDGIALTVEEKDTVGNGSIANVLMNVYEARGQRFAGLQKVLIKNLVVYTGSSTASDLMDDDTATSSSVSELEDD